MYTVTALVRTYFNYLFVFTTLAYFVMLLSTKAMFLKRYDMNTMYKLHF